jgi:hypothetical protein
VGDADHPYWSKTKSFGFRKTEIVQDTLECTHDNDTQEILLSNLKPNSKKPKLCQSF